MAHNGRGRRRSAGSKDRRKAGSGRPANGAFMSSLDPRPPLRRDHIEVRPVPLGRRHRRRSDVEEALLLIFGGAAKRDHAP